MFTDIVGYSAVMQQNEDQGRLIRDRHKAVFEKSIGHYQGRIVQYFGDGTLSVFDSAVSAVECAISMQRELKTYPQVPLRIGIHLGDIHYDDTEVYGHGVNVAARIEPVCNPGGIFISNKVYQEIRNHPWLKAKSLGVYRFKNIDEDLELFAIQDKQVAFPNAADIAMVRELSQKINVSVAAERSEAVRRYNLRQKRRRRQAISRWGAIGLIVLLGLVAVWRLSDVLAPAPADDGRVAIAVLPFENMSSEPDNEYFSDGMTEDILTKLSRIEGLSVTSRTSVMQYKGKVKGTRQIARELNVDYILEGSVRRSGDRVRIVAQLIDGRNDEHLWAHTYDQKLTDIFDVQSQVAEDIASQLKTELSPAERQELQAQPAKNYTAYDVYLKGRKKYREYTAESNDEAIWLFYKALQIDPDYAYALAGLGDAYAQKAYHNGMNQAYLDTAILMSARAIEADPKLSEGYKALGLAYQYQGETDRAIVQYEQALQLDPNNDMAANNLGVIERQKGNIKEAAKWAHRTMNMNKGVPSSIMNMADIYLELGDEVQAQALLDKGLDIHPEAPSLQLMKGVVELRQGHLESARQHTRKAIEAMPENPQAYQILGDIEMFDGNWGDAARHFDQALEQLPESERAERVMVKSLKTYNEYKNGQSMGSGQWDAILAELDELDQSGPKYRQMTEIIRAGIHSELGNVQEAISHLSLAAEHGWMDYKTAQNHPIFARIHDHSGFKQLLARLKQKADNLRLEVNAATKSDS